MTLGINNLPPPVRRVARQMWRRGIVARKPPVCPPGWEIGPPDFVGMGVQKGGTSWWHRLILDHPQVWRAPGQMKELHFFDEGHARAFTSADSERYHRFFPRPPGGFAGEWTPRYLPDFWTHGELKLAAPDTKILILLRDPVERYRSGVTHEVNRGDRHRPIVALEAMYRGLYHFQLKALLRHFPREQILVLQYEQCRREAIAQLSRTYEFLGLDDIHFVPEGMTEVVNGTPSEKITLPAQVRSELVSLYEPSVLDLVRDFPDIDLALWPNFRHLLTESVPAHE